MIHIDLQPEPIHFDESVRRPGKEFLEECPHPVGDDWKKNRYWNRCADDLYKAYGGICAYTGQWFSKSVSTVSVDHYLPKSLYPEKAYEWDNYRLTYQMMNSFKGDKITLDPFKIHNGDIVLDFPSCLVKPKRDSSYELKKLAWFTINTLKLNHEIQVSHRYEVVANYASGYVTRHFLEQKYPFIAMELKRQNMYTKIKDIFRVLQTDV